MSNWWKVTRNGQSLYWDHEESREDKSPELAQWRKYDAYDVARAALHVALLHPSVDVYHLGDKPMRKLIPTGQKACGFTLYMEGAL